MSHKNIKVFSISIVFLFFSLISLGFSSENIYYNYGLKKSNDPQKIYLTIDLCPSSKKGIDTKLFNSLVELSKQYKQPIPVGISVSGLWILKHKKGLEEIKKLEKKNYLQITWINHTYSHYYNSKLPNNINFMLHDQSKAKQEIEENVKVMVNNGLKPSKFFRFPGLISNDYLNNLVKKEGLTVVGTNAWLAKTKGHFKGGDIILIHGNLNEPLGVSLFINDIKNGSFNKYKFDSLNNIDYNHQL